LYGRASETETLLSAFDRVVASGTPELVLGAATSIGGLIIVRFAATVSSDLRLAVHSFLRQFAREIGLGPFRVPKMWSC
jgi:hypothetical protein